MQWINPFKMIGVFKRVLDHVIDTDRLGDPYYRDSIKRIAKMPDTEIPNATATENASPDIPTVNVSNAPGRIKVGIQKKTDNRKQHSRGNNSFSLYMPQVRHAEGKIIKIGDFEFAGQWTNIPYVIMVGAGGNLFVERLGIPLSPMHEPQEYQQYGLPFQAAEAMRWAFLANDKISWSMCETRLLERHIEKSIVVYDIENIDVYKCAMWENRHQQITGNGVAERVVDLYRDEKKD